MWIVIGLMLVQPSAAKAASVDACALVASADVHRVLGVDVKGRRPIAPGERGILSQCYVDTGSARSVSIAVMEDTDAKEAKDTKEREPDARRIDGIGDEAWWSGTRVAGALYVRRGDRLIRVSVGGIAIEPDRIEKSRQLAAAALRRLTGR